MTTIVRARAVVAPLVSSSMSAEEIIRAAEHAFPAPSPIVALLIQRLADLAFAPTHQGPVSAMHAVNCPACGGALHIEVNTEDDE